MTTVYDFKLDPITQDIAIVNGDLVPILDRGEAIRQDVEQSLKMYKGEWFLDREPGVDYHGIVFAPGMDLGAIAAEYRRVILSRPGIADVYAMTLTVDAEQRTLEVSWSADSDQAPAPISSTTRVTL